MARPLRLEFERAVYHVTSRGDDRAAIFRADRNRERFLTILGGFGVSHSLWYYAANGDRAIRLSGS